MSEQPVTPVDWDDDEFEIVGEVPDVSDIKPLDDTGAPGVNQDS